MKKFITDPLIFTDDTNLEGVHRLGEVSKVLGLEILSLLRILHLEAELSRNLFAH
jgi:hypothetical protein